MVNKGEDSRFYFTVIAGDSFPFLPKHVLGVCLLLGHTQLSAHLLVLTSLRKRLFLTSASKPNFLLASIPGQLWAFFLALNSHLLACFQVHISFALSSLPHFCLISALFAF